MSEHATNCSQLKPVPCGCGGEASLCYGFEHRNIYAVECNKCGICTCDYDTASEAITAWNRAMSGKDEIAIAKGYWMATYDGLHCSVCNYKCETTALPEVCPHCGTRLIRW